jgi:deoxyribodipyrimidine photo-lyase
VELWRGKPAEVLEGRRLAASYTPVPGWRALAEELEVSALYPWPWLHRPHAGAIQSFSQWRKVLPRLDE